MKELINAHIFEPYYKNVKARCELLYCDNHENCPVLKKGKCLHVLGIVGPGWSCPHGSYSIYHGYTKAARNFRNWLNDKKKQYEAVLDKVDCQNFYKKIASTGDYIYLPYPYLKNYVNPLPFMINPHFCKVEDFTPENIMQIINFRPKAFFGGEIDSFQKQEVPRFIDHLMTEMPDIYKKLIEKYPEVLAKFPRNNMNYINRTAILKSCKIGSKFTDVLGNEFTWDGQYLICENWESYSIPFNIKRGYLKLEPSENTLIRIMNNNQVDENTAFFD